MTFRIAWRNLWRNRRRTGLALAAIGLSVALVLAYDSILRAYGDWMLQTITGPMLGDAQVHAPGWRKDRAMDRTLRKVSGALAAIRDDRETSGASARIYAPVLAAIKEEGFAVLVIGVDDVAESGPARLLSGLNRRLGERQVLMGRPLAVVMNVRPGDAIALVGQGIDGSLANDLFTVMDLVDTPVDLVNRQGVIMSLPVAQTFFAMHDEAHEIVIHARDPAQVNALTSRITALPELQNAEILDWKRLAPELVSLVRIVELAWIFVLILVFVAAAAGIANTMLMATFERSHEFGMMLALGTEPGRLVRMILAESLVLGVIGAAIGTILGVSVVAITHRTGIDYAALTGGGPSEISFAGLKWSMLLYPTLAFEDVARVVSAVVATSLVACIWPAMRVARLQPADALRE